MSPWSGTTVLVGILTSTFTSEEMFPRSPLVCVLCYPRPHRALFPPLSK